MGDRRRGRQDRHRDRSPRRHWSTEHDIRQATRKSVPPLSSTRHWSPVRPPSASPATISRKRPAGAASESKPMGGASKKHRRSTAHQACPARGCSARLRGTSASQATSSRKRPAWAASESKPMGGASKKPRRSTAHQACPARGCSVLTKYLKDHVYEEHLPSLSHQLQPRDRAVNNVHRQRLNGLHQLAVGVLGANASIQGIVDHLDNISVVIRDRITIWGQLQSDMGALCRFAGWHVPEEFVVYPTINSPAALLYWRILLYLLEQLQESDRAEFSQSYGAQRPKGSTGAIPSGKSLRDSAQPEVVPRHTESLLVEEQDPQRTRVISTEGPMEHVKISIGADPRGSPHRDPTWDPVSQHLFSFDSHFHFDRTA